MRVNDDVIGRGAKHRGNFAAKRLRIPIGLRRKKA
jgi:hypothetical protein